MFELGKQYRYTGKTVPEATNYVEAWTANQKRVLDGKVRTCIMLWKKNYVAMSDVDGVHEHAYNWTLGLENWVEVNTMKGQRK